LAGENLGEGAARIGFALFVTSVFAALLSFHNAVARYLFALGREGVLPRLLPSPTAFARYRFALGREGVLPRLLGRTSSRSGAPKVGSLVQSALALIVILTYLVLDLDPLGQLFFLVGLC